MQSDKPTLASRAAKAALEIGSRPKMMTELEDPTIEDNEERTPKGFPIF